MVDIFLPTHFIKGPRSFGLVRMADPPPCTPYYRFIAALIILLTGSGLDFPAHHFIVDIVSATLPSIRFSFDPDSQFPSESPPYLRRKRCPTASSLVGRKGWIWQKLINDNCVLLLTYNPAITAISALQKHFEWVFQFRKRTDIVV